MRSLEAMAARWWWLMLVAWAGVAQAAVVREHLGRLTTPSGAAVRGPVDLEVLLYRAEDGGDPLLPAPLSFAGVQLDDGRFRIRVELSDADSVVVFGARGDATVWVQLLDQTNDRVYPRQKMTGTAEVVTAVTPPAEPGTGLTPPPPSRTASAVSTAPGTESGLATAIELARTVTATATTTATAPGTVGTGTGTGTGTETGLDGETASQPMPDPATSIPDEPLELGLPTATFVESPLAGDPTAGRAELGTAGRCGEAGSAGAFGEVRFQEVFAAPPRVFLQAEGGEGRVCVPHIVSRHGGGFAWSSGGGLAGLDACDCLHWMAVGR
jgi:hypothetical protein